MSEDEAIAAGELTDEAFYSTGARGGGARDQQGPDHGGGEEEAKRVEVEAGLLRQPGHERAGGNRRQKAHRVKRLRHERVRCHQLFLGDQGADCHRLCRAKEARNQSEQGEDGTQLSQVGNPEQQQNQHTADKIAADHHLLHGPAIDKNTGNRTDQRQREHIRDQQIGDLRRRAMPAEGDQADDTEHR